MTHRLLHILARHTVDDDQRRHVLDGDIHALVPISAAISAMADAEIMPDAIRAIADERHRQITGEKWNAHHDDAHTDGSLAKAAACYALGATSLTGTTGGKSYRRIIWPRSWAIRWWKPKNRRRDLVRSGALIVAEIDRLDRIPSTATS